MTAVCRLLALDFEVVGSVTDGELLLEAANRLQPDVIVLDVNLPKVKGLDACRQLVQAHPEMKIIVFTAVLDPAVEHQSFAAGASAFVSKLAGAGELVSTITRLSDGLV
jgi:DNA-binding NarL/FixJ family response regulator